jgi:hypothetical protein
MKKSEIYRVQLPNRIEEFCNASAARRYAASHGGTILAANEPAAIGGLGSQSQSPIVNPYTASLLGLPFNATTSEYETAWQANGNQSATLNTPKVRDALIALAMKQQGMSLDRATDFVRQRCPQLFADLLRKAAGAANERGIKRQAVAAYLANGWRLAANETPVVLAVGPVMKTFA